MAFDALLRPTALLTGVRTRARAVERSYAALVEPEGPVPPPLAGHLLAIGTFGAVVATAGLRSRHRLPDSYRVVDIALGGVAIHKLSRIIAKESVASPLRAPFTHFVEPTGAAELHEEPREGPLKSLGELITCPFCLAPWLATAYITGLVNAPRYTRAAAALFAAVAVSDALQHALARLDAT